MKTISFVGCISGDFECFCWDKVGETAERLYPDSVMQLLDCEPDKHYKFTISVEEVNPELDFPPKGE